MIARHYRVQFILLNVEKSWENFKSTHSSVFSFPSIKVCSMFTIICEVLLMFFFLKELTCFHDSKESSNRKGKKMGRQHLLIENISLVV